MAVEDELMHLRRKVNRLEETVTAMNDRIGLILEKFLSFRASQVKGLKNLLLEEEDICTSLVSKLTKLKSCVTSAGADHSTSRSSHNIQSQSHGQSEVAAPRSGDSRSRRTHRGGGGDRGRRRRRSKSRERGRASGGGENDRDHHEDKNKNEAHASGSTSTRGSIAALASSLASYTQQADKENSRPEKSTTAAAANKSDRTDRADPHARVVAADGDGGGGNKAIDLDTSSDLILHADQESLVQSENEGSEGEYQTEESDQASSSSEEDSAADDLPLKRRRVGVTGADWIEKHRFSNKNEAHSKTQSEEWANWSVLEKEQRKDGEHVTYYCRDHGKHCRAKRKLFYPTDGDQVVYSHNGLPHNEEGHASTSTSNSKGLTDQVKTLVNVLQLAGTNVDQILQSIKKRGLPEPPKNVLEDYLARKRDKKGSDSPTSPRHASGSKRK